MAEGIIATQEDIEIIKNRVTEFAVTFYTDDTHTVGEDMSAYTAQAQARESADPDSAEICSFTIDETNKATGVFILTYNDKTGIITQDAGLIGFWDLALVDGSDDPVSYMYGYAPVVHFPTVVTP